MMDCCNTMAKVVMCANKRGNGLSDVDKILAIVCYEWVKQIIRIPGNTVWKVG